VATRLVGTLVRWTADRGFGFIAPDGGGNDVFVHASDMSRIGGAPEVGWRLDFQVRPGKDGRMRAFDVQREGMRLSMASPDTPREVRRYSAPAARSARRPPRDIPRRARKSPVVLVAILVLGTAGFLVQRATSPSPVSSAPMLLSDPAAAGPATASWSCDGRTRCPQMKSCEEATWFVHNCPNTEMDGDGDGIPCEQQWCD
jgi:cold shock CspA family protein